MNNILEEYSFMKWVVTTFISIAVPLLIYFLGFEKSDIVYTVSDNIPMSTNTEKTSNIQQIEIKNVGNHLAKEIQIKIEGKINNSRVIKDSELDKLEIYNAPFELIYSELPPDGSFKLIVESSLNELNEDVITAKEIYHLRHLFYHSTPMFLPGVAKLFTNKELIHHISNEEEFFIKDQY